MDQKPSTANKNRPAHGGPARTGAGGGRGGPNRGGGGRGSGRGPGRGGPRREENTSGFKEKVLDLRRVTRVVQGGKRFRFRATVVIGDEKGQVGIGVAKGLDVAQAVSKAKTEAGKKMLSIALKDNRTIAHEVYAKYSAAKVLVKPASAGHGLRAGGAVRFVLAMAGVKDATAKCLGRTPNKLTNAWATLEALKLLKNRVSRTKTQPKEAKEMTASEAKDES